MGIEVRPLGVKCNIQCQYCYQDPQRDAGNTLHQYDIQKLKKILIERDQSFTLFGGEPLLTPIADLEELFALGLEKHGSNSIQTNGTLISPEHIDIFKKYKVAVGISMDGPGPLNDVRWTGNLRLTRETTQKSENAIAELCAAGMPPSLIVTLHQGNARPDVLPELQQWFFHLDELGVTSARLHVLEVDSPAIQQRYALSMQENVDILLSFAELETRLTNLRFDLFSEMRRLLKGQDRHTTCVWNGCDPYTTSAVQGIEGNGQQSNCGRTNKDGIDFVKANMPGFERSIALYHTPYEHGGCKDCRFFLMCKGQCPGTALEHDFRNRSEHCEIWYKLFCTFEKELVEQKEQPLSLSSTRTTVEKQMITHWSQGSNLNIQDILEQLPTH